MGSHKLQKRPISFTVWTRGHRLRSARLTEGNGGVLPPKQSKRSNSLAPKLQDEVEKQDPQTFFLSVLGLKRLSAQLSLNPRPQPTSQPILNARGKPARFRKRNRFFFNDNIINDNKPLRMSLSPREPPSIATSSGASKSVQSTPVKTPAKLLKKRKLSGRHSRPVSTKKAVPITTTKSISSAKSASSTNLSSPAPSSKKQTSAPATPLTRGSASQPPVSIASTNTSVDKSNGQRTGLRLRNLLKQPKAHRFVMCEWFYSFIDRVLFDHNDFARSLNEYFPDLKDFTLTRGEWRIIRRMMGSPRRCSAKFFAEERKELERKRQKIRILQSRKPGEIKDSNFMRELPDQIPLSLPIGTKVTARLRNTQDGIFSGTIDSFDSVSSIYRVTLTRPGLGTHSVPDYEIASENFFEILSVRAIAKEYRAYMAGASLFEQESVNGFPIKLLETVVRLKRLLDLKRVKLNHISNMNNDSELKIAKNLTKRNVEQYDDDDNDDDVEEIELPANIEEFQRRYAFSLISLEKQNRDIKGYLKMVQAFANDLKLDPKVQAMLAPTFSREKCREEAEIIMEHNNRGLITNPNILKMLNHITTVLVTLSKRGEGENEEQVNKVLKGFLEEMKNDINPVNRDHFQKNVLQHFQHIYSGISTSNNMEANNSRLNE